MLTDPQVVTINSVAQSMPRTGMTDTSGTFQQADGTHQLQLQHFYGKRNRHSVRLVTVKTTADPIVPSTNQIVSASYTLSVDMPKQGFTNAEAKLDIVGFLTAIQASTGALITQLLGGES